MIAAMPSSADLAFERFSALQPELNELAKRTWSETDTRCKLVEPLFKEVLAWSESDITREEPVQKGFADYLFSIDGYRHFHVEAKRTLPRWELHAPQGSRNLRLGGPHLLGNKKLRRHIEQTQKYAHTLGTQFAVLTNGTQLIVFRSIVIGHDWRAYDARCWLSLDDISEDFAAFHALLSRDAVVSGSLRVALTPALVSEELFRPAEFSARADAEFVRNPFWSRIANTVGPLLTDDPGNLELAHLIITNCYVATPLSDQVDASISDLLKDLPTSSLRSAGVVDLKPGMHGNTAFGFSLADDVAQSNRPGTYIITGGVGSGKTTFLRRYAAVVAPAFVKAKCVWLSIDFLPIGAMDPARQSAEVSQFAFKECRAALKSLHAAVYPPDGKAVRALFQEEVTTLRKTRLYEVAKASQEARQVINETIDRLWSDDELVTLRILRRARAAQLRPVIVFDNTDQLGEAAQEAVFLLAQKVAKECDALSIVALREEKFFAAYRRGVFDAFGDRRFHIGSPDLANVIRRRLQYAIAEYETRARGESVSIASTADINNVVHVLKCLIRSTTSQNANIVRFLACISNGDMRYALAAFRDFVSSGNTDIDKIQRILREHGGYTVPFHEFAKSAILGSRRYYQASTSHVVNIFRKSHVPGASHLTATRLLARLSASQTAASPHGEGFIQTDVLVDEWTRLFGRTDDLVARSEELIRRGLVETEPPRVFDLRRTDALRIAASGAYYWLYLARSFAYLDLVYFDTPLVDRDLARRLASMSATTEMQVRFDRVRLFLDYLAASERAEHSAAGDDGAYRASLLVQIIQEQIESEFDWIRRKLADPSLD
jgi:hypothetical protein